MTKDIVPRALYIRLSESRVVSAELLPPIDGVRIVSMSQNSGGIILELVYENIGKGGPTHEPDWVEALGEHIGFPASITLRFAMDRKNVVWVPQGGLMPSEREISCLKH